MTPKAKTQDEIYAELDEIRHRFGSQWRTKALLNCLYRPLIHEEGKKYYTNIYDAVKETFEENKHTLYSNPIPLYNMLLTYVWVFNSERVNTLISFKYFYDYLRYENNFNWKLNPRMEYFEQACVILDIHSTYVKNHALGKPKPVKVTKQIFDFKVKPVKVKTKTP